MSDAYNDGYQKQVNESGFYPMEYDSKIGYYTPNGAVDGVDIYVDFDEMSFSKLKPLCDKSLEQVGHTPWNKISNARPDIFSAVNAIEEELEETARGKKYIVAIFSINISLGSFYKYVVPKINLVTDDY